MIVSCAILIGNTVLVGAKRHTDLVTQAFKQRLPLSDAIYGFVTDDKPTARFLTRVEARKHAEECGQLTPPLFPPAEPESLISEELWPNPELG